MKNLAERVFSQLPSYLPVLVALIGKPKRTIAAKSSGKEDDLHNAVVFVGITVGIGFLLQAPAMPPETDFIMAAAAMAAFKVVAILVFSGIFWGTFRLVGGRADYLRTLTAYLYMISPLYLVLVVLSLVGSGFVRAYDPDLGLRLKTDPLLFLSEPETLATFQAEAPELAMAMTVTNYASSLAAFVWPIICLGAFRAQHGVTRLRSAVACALSAILWWPYAGLLIFLLIGTFGSIAPPLQ